MFEERINFLSPAVNLTLKQRAEEIYSMHYAISEFFEKKEWIISGKVAIEIDKQSDVVTKILKHFKKEIRRNTVLKDVSDDYMDNVPSSLTAYYLKYHDDSLIFTYSLGRKDDMSKYSEMLIFNYKLLIDLLGNENFEKLIKKIVDLTDTIKIEVTDDGLAEKFKQLFTNASVEIVTMS